MSKADVDEGRRVWDLVSKGYRGLSKGCFRALLHAYRTGCLTKPLHELADEELLAIWGLGQKRLREIREIAPRG